MNIVRIDKDNMLNGEGIRAVLWTTGCSHHCKNCHNPETWDPQYGHKFNEEDKKYLFDLLSRDYIAGVTFTGGDPMFCDNREEIFLLSNEIREKFYNKNIWLYTGYTIEQLNNMGYSNQWLAKCFDVIVDGEFKEELKNIEYKWAGSTNQRVLYRGKDY